MSLKDTLHVIRLSGHLGLAYILIDQSAIGGWYGKILFSGANFRLGMGVKVNYFLSNSAPLQNQSHDYMSGK